MENSTLNIGFSYFTSPNYMIGKHLNEWLPFIKQLGASAILFQGDFDRAIPEDAIIAARENGLEPILQFNVELPLARKFNETAVLLDVYAKWGIKTIIFGDKPNTKAAWQQAGWHYEHLINHFVDRFIPVTNHAVKLGINPVFPPLRPGGDYWDTAFIELALAGLRRRRMDTLLDKLILSAFGFTFDKPMTWGQGGPEQWPASKPYLTPEGQEDQLGFHNFEWIQAYGERATGIRFPVILLDAGHTGTVYSQPDAQIIVNNVVNILTVSRENFSRKERIDGLPLMDESVRLCTFSLDTLMKVIGEDQLSAQMKAIFSGEMTSTDAKTNLGSQGKMIDHYLLLPAHASGVSDIVLSKVRPIIKKYHPTVGFSLQEAKLARKVSVFPDSILFSDVEINALRTAGCEIEVLPESGIEIATILQTS